MKKSILILSLIIFIGMGFNVFAKDADVIGKWEMTSQSSRGERTSVLEFYLEDSKLMVKWDNRRGALDTEVNLEGNKISWEVTRETPRGEFTMKYSGTVKDNTMEGTMSIEQMDRSMEWTAKKQ